MIKDNYDSNVKLYYSALLKNKLYIENMFDLVESISQGFNYYIDEILITKSALINEYGGKLFEKKYEKNSIIYVLEGNRRLMAIHLLLNINGSRDLLKEKTKEFSIKNIYKKFDEIFKRIDNDPNLKISFKNIHVKFYDTESTKNVEIWKTLNAKHFGKRKGKLNWPRGQVLNFIYENVNQLRKKLGLNIGDKIDEDDFTKIKIELENFTGKVINEKLDLKSALFVNWAIEIFNKYNDEEISFSNAFDLDDELSDELSDELIKNKKKGDFFSVSSLELSMNQIRLLHNGSLKSLGDIIELDINIKTWKITSNLDNKVLEYLIVYIIKLIKDGKLNTRRFDKNYSSTIYSIIQLESKNLDNEIIRDISKIKFSNVTLGMILSIKNKNNFFDKISFSNESSSSIEKEIISILHEIVAPTLGEILNMVSKSKKFLEKCNNIFEYTLVRLWGVEAVSLIKNYDNIIIDELPITLFSSLIRITSELLKLWFLVETVKDVEYYIPIVENKKSNFLNNLSKHYNGKYSYYIDSLMNNNEDNKKTSCKINYAYSFVCDNLEKDNLDMLFGVFFSSYYDLKKTNKLQILFKNFMEWINNEKNIGKINKLMHEPHIIKNIHDKLFDYKKLSDYRKFSNELKEYVKKITSFINCLME